MLNFINDEDYTLASFKQNNDSSVTWTYAENGNFHTGVIFEGLVRKMGEESTIDVWQNLQDKINDGSVIVEQISQAELDAKAIEEFKREREKLIAESVVTISTGKSFDADEKSISRLHNAITYLKEHNVAEIPWSTADVDSGIMVTCSAAEIIEAHRLAVENMTALWTFNQNQ